MSLENEDQNLLDQPTNHELQKNRKLKISYTREFLLSLSELDICKELPSGFDQSVLSEFEDALLDPKRSTGGLSMHSFRRNEYGSSPPTPGDTNSFLRGTNGKWETRSSGRSDKDSDSQSEWESDSGKHFGNQSRRSWQGPEHDGLLGSGSFPRPSGHAPGLSAPKFQADGNYQLNRTNEPYQRPRPYKAPHSRSTHDNYNDETFGSSECASEDRAEEERKRRASFELMRKEQQKAFQEKQKLNPDKNKNDFDISSLLDSDEKRLVTRINESAEPPAVLSALSDDSEKPSLAHIPSSARPLVPPGFASIMLERNSGVKTSTNTRAIEPDHKADETLSPHAFQSSKFAHWFVEEEKKPLDDFTHRPNDLLSLIVGGEKGVLQVSDLEKTRHVAPASPFQNAEPADVAHTTTDKSEQLCKSDKPELVPAVLTCEYLEQSILTQVSENDLSLPQPMQDNDFYAKTVQSNSNINNDASQHLLSLLQKGTCHKDMEQSSILDVEFADKVCNTEGTTTGNILDDPGESNADGSNSSKQLTLETLFGTAFMRELQSVGAPLSVQRGSVESAGPDVSDSILSLFPASDNGLPPAGEHALNRHGSIIQLSGKANQPKPNRFEEQWLVYGDPQGDVNSSQLQNEFAKASGFDGANDIHLPEEDSLIAVSDPLQNFLFAGNSAKTDLSRDRPIDITGKLAALNPAFGVEQPIMGNQEGLAYSRGPYDMREPGIPSQNFNVQRSSRLHPSQLSHMGRMFNQMDSHPPHISSYMKPMTPEGMIHRESPPNHQFPGNMHLPPFNQPSSALSGFDPPAYHSILQQMHMQGNLPPPHLFRGFPGGGPLPAHPSNPMTGFMQEPNPMQGFPFSGHQQSPYGGPGMAPQASDVAGGRNHPETLQRLFEMELRSRARPGF